jgi:hypothetical protein
MRLIYYSLQELERELSAETASAIWEATETTAAADGDGTPRAADPLVLRRCACFVGQSRLTHSDC